MNRRHQMMPLKPEDPAELQLQPGQKNHSSKKGSTVNIDNLPQEINPDVLTMSSREIAQLCDKRHYHVLRDVKKMLEGLEIGATKFGGTYIDEQGKEWTQYLLPKDLTLTLVAGYNVKLRKRIIDRWLELEEHAGKPAMLSGPQLMAAALIEANNTLKAQAAEIESMREDVEAHGKLVKAEGSVTITEAAKNLGMRPKELFTWLSQNGWTYKRAGSPSWLGYQSRCNTGDLEHKTTTVLRADGSERISEQVRVTARGLSKLARLKVGVAHEVLS